MSQARAKKKQRRRARATPVREPVAKAPAEPRPSRFEVRDTRSLGGSQGAGGVARPQPPWAPFPLTEIGMAAGVAIFVAGLLADGRRSAWLLGVGVLVLTVVVVELCLREHFAGFRSHTLLLAVLPVAVLDGVLVLALGDALRGPFVLVVALALVGALAWLLQRRYKLAHERARERG